MLIIEASVTSYEDSIYLCSGDNIFCTLERIESNLIKEPCFQQSYYVTIKCLQKLHPPALICYTLLFYILCIRFIIFLSVIHTLSAIFLALQFVNWFSLICFHFSSIYTIFIFLLSLLS